MILALLAAVERLEKAIAESRTADTQRDAIQNDGGYGTVAYAKASGACEGACAALRISAERVCILLRGEGL